MSMAKKAFSRLPKAIRPIKYHLRLKPDLAAFTFRGWMKVELDVAEATDTIVCNAAELGRFTTAFTRLAIEHEIISLLHALWYITATL